MTGIRVRPTGHGAVDVSAGELLTAIPAGPFGDALLAALSSGHPGVWDCLSTLHGQTYLTRIEIRSRSLLSISSEVILTDGTSTWVEQPDTVVLSGAAYLHLPSALGRALIAEQQNTIEATA